MIILDHKMILHSVFDKAYSSFLSLRILLLKNIKKVLHLFSNSIMFVSNFT